MKASGILVAVLMAMAGGTSAADFSDLQTFKSSDVETVVGQSVEVPLFPAYVTKHNRGHAPCEANAIAAIKSLAGGISNYTSPTISNARNVVSIGRSCDSLKVKLAAINACSKGLSDYTEPTTSVAQAMETLCDADSACAAAAVEALGAGISFYNSPTIEVARSIVNIVKRAPYDKVKRAAIASLSEGISDYTHPTEELSAAIVEVGSCSAH